MDFDDSHTRFLPPSRTSRIEYGWQMRMIGDKCYVVAVKPSSDAEAKGLKVGNLILSIDGYEPTRENLWKIQYSYYTVRPQPGMRLAIQSIDGQQRQMDVMAKITQGRQVLRLHSDDIWKLLIEAESESRLNRHRYHDMADVMIWKMPQWDLGNRQVDNMMDKVRSDLHIGGFQVTMDDALLMGGLYTFSNLTANFQGFLNRQWAFGNTLLEGLAWDQLQHQKMHVIRVLKAIDSCDVGVIQ